MYYTTIQFKALTFSPSIISRHIVFNHHMPLVVIDVNIRHHLVMDGIHP